MIWSIAVVLLVLWVALFLLKIGGGIIHILLVIAAIVVVYRLVTGRKPIP